MGFAGMLVMFMVPQVLVVPLTGAYVALTGAFVETTSAQGQSATQVVGQTDVIHEVFTALRMREEVVHSARFVWSEKRTIFSGAFQAPDGSGVQPDEDVITSKDGITFQFDRNRFLYKYYLNDTQGEGNINSLSAHSYDGMSVQSYHPAIQLEYGEALIHGDDAFHEFSNFNIWPFLLAFRALPERGAGLENAPLVECDTSTDREQREVCVEWRVSSSHRRFYLDPNREYRLVRFQEYRDPDPGESWLESELVFTDYISDSAAKVDIPSRWELKRFGPHGQPRMIVICQLTDHSVNSPESLESFTLSPFPVGTLVVNERDGKTSWQREDGTLELVSSIERLPAKIERRSFAKWLMLANAILFVFVVVYVVYFRRSTS